MAVNQSKLIRMFISYLSFRIESSIGLSDDFKQELIEQKQYLQSTKGICAGYSTVKTYGHYVDDRAWPENLDSSQILLSASKIDELIKMLELNKFWELEEYNLKDIDFLIKVIIRFQKPSILVSLGGDYKQMDLEKTLRTPYGSVSKAFSYNFTGSKEIVCSRLERLLKSNFLVFVSSNRHQMGIYKKSTGSVIIFDPNGAEQEVSSVKEITDVFFNGTCLDEMVGFNSRVTFVDILTRNMEIEIFSIGNNIGVNFPSTSELNFSVGEVRSIFSQSALRASLYAEQVLLGIEDEVKLEILEDDFLKNKIDLIDFYKERLERLSRDFVVRFSERYINNESQSDVDSTTENEMESSVESEESEDSTEHEQLIKSILKTDNISNENLNVIKKFKIYLSLDQALLVLSKFPGDLELAEEILNSCENNFTTAYMYNTAIFSNIDINNIWVCKSIIDIIYRRCDGFIPPPKQVESWDRLTLLRHMRDNYDAEYIHRFGKSLRSILNDNAQVSEIFDCDSSVVTSYSFQGQYESSTTHTQRPQDTELTQSSLVLKNIN